MPQHTSSLATLLDTPVAPSKLPAWVRQSSQSATYPRAYVEAACEQGIDRERLLALAQVPAALLDDPAGRLSLLDTWKVCAAAWVLTADPCIGFDAGYRMPLTAHGSLGYALMCCTTPREAIAILERFWHLRGRGAAFKIVEQEDALFLELGVEISFDTALTHIMFSAILTSMYRSITFLIPKLPQHTELWLASPAPKGIEAWRQRLPGLRFDMPCSGLALQGDMSLLNQRLPNANPEALAQALAQCERESLLLEAVDDTTQQLRRLLHVESQGYLTPAEVAAQLHLTSRTLRRRLKEQGSSYQQLLEEARRRDSCRLLNDPALSISHIGELLGYTDPANFTRAFKNWYGITPSDWRQQQD